MTKTQYQLTPVTLKELYQRDDYVENILVGDVYGRLFVAQYDGYDLLTFDDRVDQIYPSKIYSLYLIEESKAQDDIELPTDVLSRIQVTYILPRSQVTYTNTKSFVRVGPNEWFVYDPHAEIVLTSESYTDANIKTFCENNTWEVLD